LLVDQLADIEVAIGTVRNHCLAWLKTERRPVEKERNDVRFERYQVGDAADLTIGVRIRPAA